jgi:4-amino-4-deoxychorismate lyase
MYQLVESIWIKNREIQNLEFHQMRYEATMSDLYPGATIRNLVDYINLDLAGDGEFKCRVLYSNKIFEVQYAKYERRKIRSLKIVFDDQIEYPYKFIKRQNLDFLFDKKNASDEIMIVKDNLLTDCYYYNIVLEHLDGSLHTPKSPLLKGIMRQKLIFENKIHESDIYLNEIKEFSKIHLINALNPIGYQNVEVKNILMD